MSQRGNASVLTRIKWTGHLINDILEMSRSHPRRLCYRVAIGKYVLRGDNLLPEEILGCRFWHEIDWRSKGLPGECDKERSKSDETIWNHSRVPQTLTRTKVRFLDIAKNKRKSLPNCYVLLMMKRYRRHYLIKWLICFRNDFFELLN